MLQEFHLPTGAMFHLEVRRMVETEPGEGRCSIDGDEEVVCSAPADRSLEDESVADCWGETREGNTCD